MTQETEYIKVKKLKLSRYRPGVAQRVGRGIALLFHDRGVRRGWVVSSTPRPHFIPRKDPVPSVQEAGWAPGPVWTGVENLAPTGIRYPDRPACFQSLYRLSYPAHLGHERPWKINQTRVSFHMTFCESIHLSVWCILTNHKVTYIHDAWSSNYSVQQEMLLCGNGFCHKLFEQMPVH
jgi:hypothetical protein